MDDLLKFAQWLHDSGYLAEPYADDDDISDNPRALVDRYIGSLT